MSVFSYRVAARFTALSGAALLMTLSLLTAGCNAPEQASVPSPGTATPAAAMATPAASPGAPASNSGDMNAAMSNPNVPDSVKDQMKSYQKMPAGGAKP